MTAISVPAETGEPFTVEHHGSKYRITRKSEFNSFTHVMLFRRSEVPNIINALADLWESS